MKRLDHKSYYINRELSWLAFNERVMAEAADVNNPLLERLNFAAITASNFDEFFMVRVAGLKDQQKLVYTHPDNKTQMTSTEQLHQISARAHRDIQQLYRMFNHSILPSLRRQGIVFLAADDWSPAQSAFVNDFYHHHIFPVLTPLAVDASHPFPMLASRSLNVAILLESEDDTADDDMLFAVVQVPSVLPRYIEMPSTDGKAVYALLEHVIQEHIDTLFPGNRVMESACFRITRNADITVDEESAEDLLEEIEKELKKRKRGAAVRLEVSAEMSLMLTDTLREWLELAEDDVYSIQGPLDLTFFAKFYNAAGYPQLRYEPIIPQSPRDLIGETRIFDAISRKDIMVFHPYESFDPVVHFINQSAADPDVLAIKQTLYRVSGHSPVVNALARAAENGKQVTVLLELKARFDEENNIVWAKKLEEAGCHVIYGLVGLKTHSKITLVVRKEGLELRRYVHLSTGNYNDTTALVYTDLGVFTANEAFGYDASAFFNHLTGFSTTPEWKRIATAPKGLKDKFLALIQDEIDKSTPEQPGYMILKFNSLTDKDMIMALFRASRAGVKIDLIIRGICCLRPGIAGVSDNIRVFSIIGRFLEHSRIFYFRHGGDELLFLSSADWMTRNMVNRVEILFPVMQKNQKKRLKQILQVHLTDNVNRYELRSRGKYEKLKARDGEPLAASQDYFYQEAKRHATVTEDWYNQITPITTPRGLVRKSPVE